MEGRGTNGDQGGACGGRAAASLWYDKVIYVKKQYSSR